MPAIESITIHGFKSIAHCDALKLTPINIIIGANGSGKSNFIEVFAFLHALRQGRLVEYVGKAGGAERVLHFGSKRTPELSISIAFRQPEIEYSISLEPSKTDTLFPVLEDCTQPFLDKGKQLYALQLLSNDGGEAGISRSPPANEFAETVQNHFGRWRLYHFHDTSSSSPMKKTCDLDDNHFLRPDGSNLAAFLYLLKSKYESEYEQICKSIQLVAPFFDDFRLQPSKLNEAKIRLEWQHTGTDQYFDASSFSDGTLRFIALATLLQQPAELRPSVILLDEPELGLHPYAIQILASLIRGAASEGTQIIASTQSPLVLDQFEPEDVLVADRVNEGTEFKRLSSTELGDWLDDYSLGQLWEKNEFGGRPRVVK
jgi:predicted ATPase